MVCLLIVMRHVRIARDGNVFSLVCLQEIGQGPHNSQCPSLLPIGRTEKEGDL